MGGLALGVSGLAAAVWLESTSSILTIQIQQHTCTLARTSDEQTSPAVLINPIKHGHGLASALLKCSAVG